MMVPIYTLKNQIEAQVIGQALESEGIEFIIRSFDDSAYDGIFIAQKGYGQVLVEEKDRERAERVIEELQG